MVNLEIKKANGLDVDLMRQFLCYEDKTQHLKYGRFDISFYEEYDNVYYYVIRDVNQRREIGYCIITEEENASGGLPYFAIQEFLIMPAYRGIGVGTHVIKQIVDDICGRGYYMVCPLDTNQAKNFWQKVSNMYTKHTYENGTFYFDKIN